MPGFGSGGGGGARAAVELPTGGYARTNLYQILRSCERVPPSEVLLFLSLPAEDQHTLLAYSLVREAEDAKAKP